MRYYPIFLDIAKRPALVIGGGAVAERKVERLIAAGAVVTVVSPRLTKGLSALSKAGRVCWVKKVYKSGDVAAVDGAALVICASESKAANAAASREAKSIGVPVNVVDDPALCSFIIPSVVDREPVVIAISTSGRSPALAKKLREEFEKIIGKEYAVFADIIGTVRTKLLKSRVNRVKKERIIAALAASPIPEWLRSGRIEEIEGFLKGLLGPRVSMKGLRSALGRAGKARRPAG